MSGKKSSSKTKQQISDLPSDILNMIASNMDKQSIIRLRNTSKAMQQSIANPMKKVQELAQLFATATFMDIHGDQDDRTRFTMYATTRNGDDIWHVAISYSTYDDRVFKYYTGIYQQKYNIEYMCVAKSKEKPDSIEGIAMLHNYVRMPQGKVHELHKYGSGKRAWLLALLYTIQTWLENPQQYKHNVKNMIKGTQQKQAVEAFSARFQEYSKILMENKINPLEINKARGLLRLDFPLLFSLMFLTPLPRHVPTLDVDPGKIATEKFRQEARERTARLNEGMLGYTKAVQTFLRTTSKSGSRASKSSKAS